MREIRLLDCTLRDGGYVNKWRFGYDVIRDIIFKLGTANIDIIECGYLREGQSKGSEYSIFHDFEQLGEVIGVPREKAEYAVMINFGEYCIDHIPEAKGNNYIIRLAFHKKDRKEALLSCMQLKQKGYQVFAQPMGTMDYSDDEFIQLIKQFNKVEVDAFYIVDSFGVIETKDFKRLVFIADHNLDPKIPLGYHSHNNMQQAYDNAKFFVGQKLERKIIIDASVFGMGRGAGNLNTEIFAKHLDECYECNYLIEPMLEIIDDHLKSIYNQTSWGYSLPYYLSAIHNCHPNYASYYSEKNMLSIKSLNEILKSIPEQDKKEFSQERAERIYQNYQKNYIDDRFALKRLKKEFSVREILVLAPGKTLETYHEEIESFVRKRKPIVISVNVTNDLYQSDYVICVNEKRLSRLKLSHNERLILTSNLRGKDDRYCTINYSSFLCKESLIADNVMLMLMNLLISLGIQKIYVAGFDGYRIDSSENYYDPTLALGATLETKLRKNEMIRQQLKELDENLTINFLTPSVYTEKESVTDSQYNLV